MGMREQLSQGRLKVLLSKTPEARLLTGGRSPWRRPWEKVIKIVAPMGGPTCRPERDHLQCNGPAESSSEINLIQCAGGPGVQADPVFCWGFFCTLCFSRRFCFSSFSVRSHVQSSGVPQQSLFRSLYFIPESKKHHVQYEIEERVK